MKRAYIFLASLAILLSACEFSLAGDVTPPPNAELSGQATATAHPLEFPAAAPDLQNGAAIYAQSCAPCHGAGGLGNGPQAGELPYQPAPIGDPQLAAPASPADWYLAVSNGNLDRYMPPFAGSLTVQERWDVLAHVYSLSREAEQMQRGATLYTEQSGTIGAIFPDASDLSTMAGYSQNDLVDQLQSALPDLSQSDLQSLAVYIQSLSLGGLEQTAAQVTDTGSQATADALVTIRGSIIYGTNQQLPAGLTATLFAYDHDQQVFTHSVDLDSSGRYAFEQVPYLNGRIYFVSVDYLGLSYFSQYVSSDGDSFDTFSLTIDPIAIYETTSAIDKLAVEKLTLVFEFSEASRLRVIEQVLISNIGDRAVTPAEDGSPVLHLSLPAAATNLIFQEGTLSERYIAEEGGFGDLRAVLPGQNDYQLLFAYDLPYTSGVRFSLPLDLPTRSVIVLIPDGDVRLDSANFQSAGLQDVQGTSYQAYVSNGAFSTGDEVDVHLIGANPMSGGGFLDLIQDDRLLIGLTALTAAVGVAWLWLRRTQPQASTAEQVMDEIIKLDERYEKGRVTERVYDLRRAELKKQLRAVLKKKK